MIKNDECQCFPGGTEVNQRKPQLG